MSNLDLHVPPRKDLIQIGLKILSVTHIKSSKIGPEMAEKVQGQSLTVRKDLANPSDLDQPLRKGQNQIDLEILSDTDTISVKKYQEMTELALFSILSQASPWLG